MTVRGIIGALVLSAVLACGTHAPSGTGDVARADLPPAAPNVLVAQQIRFATAEGAEQRRAKMISSIWGTDRLPDTQPRLVPDATLPPGVTIDAGVVARVDALVADIGDTGMRARSYVLRPVTPTADGDRFVILHQGHVGVFDGGGLGRAASMLLRRGVNVIAMQMPLFGWNGSGRDRWRTHGEMFKDLTPEEFSHRLRIFLEPVVQNVTWALASSTNVRVIGIAGLSGGGWTTSVAAALDPRLTVSMEVAGSAPLYARTTQEDLGDREQYEESFFGEYIAEDGTGGGVATWLEIYVLAGHGAGRRAFQVNNEHDPCCFAAPIGDSYAPIVRERLRAVGPGEWSNVVDRGAVVHEISEWAVSSVLVPALFDAR